MHLLRQLRNRFRYRRFAADVAEELEFHRHQTALNGETNVPRVMGNELRMRERARDVWIPPTIEALRQDLRDAIRLLGRRPGFTALVTAVLVVGVTVSVVAFALVDALVLRALPVDRPHELVYLRAPSFSFPQIHELRSRGRFLSQSFAWNLSTSRSSASRRRSSLAYHPEAIRSSPFP
ncbi:MAG TPA: hypothetical protein VMO26_03915 [Vicinamibacterales bacterium]|nr:hypothetical protein [Vicinamibacterales bacterium]